MHFIVSLSKTLYSLLCTGSTQEDPPRHDRTTVDWDVKNQDKQIMGESSITSQMSVKFQLLVKQNAENKDYFCF